MISKTNGYNGVHYFQTHPLCSSDDQQFKSHRVNFTVIKCPYKSQFLLLKFTMLVKSPPLLLEHQCPQSSFPPSHRMGARNHLRVMSLIRRRGKRPYSSKKNTFYYSPEFLSWSRPSASPVFPPFCRLGSVYLQGCLWIQHDFAHIFIAPRHVDMYWNVTARITSDSDSE